MMAVSQPALRGECKTDFPLAGLTSWKVGGPAERCYRPADRQDLGEFLVTLPADEPLTWLGLGSNLLVRDGGVRGTVIATHPGLGAIGRVAAGLRAAAGVPCAKVARFAASQGLSGAEFLAGIPGTLGGALAMNAGAYGGETWDCIVTAETINRHGHIQRRPAKAFEASYRQVQIPADEWFVGAEFALASGDKAASLRRIRALLAARGAAQPIGIASSGSVFRNPPNDHAARLVDSAGLKGCRIGGARVADKHANFILNDGHASAADIEALIEYVQACVETIHGVRLIPEVRITGECL